tara:strand:- start:896 stop:1144 length:249 start_codon:yes stop_codon:yes gene_type:complete
MIDYDNTKSFIEYELEKAIDERKETAIATHMSQISVMDRLLIAIDEYTKTFGEESNVYKECIVLYAKIKGNKKHLQEWVDKI